MKILTAHQMRNIDRRAISRFQVPGIVLMENAGRAVVEHLLDVVEEMDHPEIAVVCGKGNNGGDGLVAARHLHDLELTPVVFLIASEDDLEGDAATNRRIVERLPIPMKTIPEAQWRNATGDVNPLLSFDIIVDALLGTGLKGRVRGNFQAIVEDINDAGAYVVSVDIPSGLSGGRSRVVGPAVRADATVTFVAPKIPHLFPPAEELCGDLIVAEIGVPAEAVAAERVKLELLDEDRIAGRLMPRADDSHKGSYGHVLIIGGSIGKAGAVRLATEAVLMAGAGLVTAAVPRSVRAEAAGFAPAMTHPLAESGSGEISRRAINPLRKLMADKAVVAIGVGAGRGKEIQATLRSLVTSARMPVVVDADGLNAFEGRDDALSGARRPLVLTPHPGEMARLAGIPTADVQADRVEVCRRFARTHSCHVVLKGYRTLVGTPEGRVFVNPTGNPGLATAGSGDVLTGLLAGLIATGVPVLDAVLVGVYAHGWAGDRGAEATGLSALTARTLLDALPQALHEIEELEP
ncbi:MAG: NAD(P)H-hydrate dehydratase [Acidobacteriota bacterium]